MKRFAISCALLLALFGGQEARAQPCPTMDASAVATFSGRPEGYRLVRSGQTISVEPFLDLRDDDEIAVLRPDGQLSLQLADRSLTTLSRGDGRRCIRRARTGLITNVMRGLGALITPQILRGVAGWGRGEDDGSLQFALPDVVAGTARISAGRRWLMLYWRGGVPPFTVSITGPNGVSIVEAGGLNARMLRLRPRPISDGRYEIRVRDAAGAVTGGHFSAASEPDPRLRDDSSVGASMLAAAHLYEMGPDRRFDAFSVLAPYFDEREVSAQGVLMGMIAATPPPQPN